MNHPGFYCSGTCGRWIHCHCAGYVFHPGPDGSENGAYLSAPLGKGEPFIVPLSPTSQGRHHPLLCIKCWEKNKQDKYQQQDHAPLSPSTFSNLRPDEQALRLGVVVDEGVSTRTMRRHITNREELLARYADGSTLPDRPSRWISIAPVTLRCERRCCSARTIPLRVCKAISSHRSQGQSVGEGHAWTKVVVGLHCKRNKTPGLE